MQTFRYNQPKSVDNALDVSSRQNGKFIAGGTTLVDLMKLNVEKPTALVDINGLPLDRVEPTPEGGLKVGALVRNSDLAWNSEVKERYTVLSEALLAGASPQLRNMATTGGNLLQRTRC
jgi:xanthine dehydrogenase YagS FAD-binding subunit